VGLLIQALYWGQPSQIFGGVDGEEWKGRTANLQKAAMSHLELAVLE